MEFSINKVETWPITRPKIEKVEIEMNNALVEMLRNAPVLDLIAAYTYVMPNDIRYLFQIDSRIFSSISGTGIDLGGGLAV